ncbi:MAG: ATP-binding cassette domain-containing protein [Caldiserica bacterium]|nr:ATP-binding cassette domain-containing protein [Caldisericota bacterium]
MTDVLLSVRDLVKHFPAAGDWFAQIFDRRVVRAVDGIGFEIDRGTTLGLVGESGSGKTTTGRIIVRLIEPTRGEILFDGIDLLKLRGKALKAMRRRIQMIFQDPASSLNPRKTVGQIVAEPLRVHGMVRGKELERRLVRTLELAGLSSRFLNRYPHELSGGQRQRVGIARALAVGPEFIVCDEPVTALDVSIQAQILNLLMDLQDELSLTYLFIAHDLSVVRHVSDRVAVMYLGKIVEIGEVDAIFSAPKHPYTQALLAAVPRPDPAAPPRKVLRGEVPSPIDPPSGCRFHPRCERYMGDICKRNEPVLAAVDGGTEVACHLYSRGG